MAKMNLLIQERIIINSNGQDIEDEIEQLGYNIKDIIWDMLSNQCY